MIRLTFSVIALFFALVGIGMAMNAFAAWVFPAPLCERCGRLSRAHVRRLHKAPKLELPGDRVWKERR